jgi:hypothetical protein
VAAWLGAGIVLLGVPVVLAGITRYGIRHVAEPEYRQIPLLIHTQPHNPPERRYGVCTVLIPALGARLTLNGDQAQGQPWPREREGRPFSTCALAFSESWTEQR